MCSICLQTPCILMTVRSFWYHLCEKTSNKTEEEMAQKLKNVSGAELEHLRLKAKLNKIECGHCMYGSLLWLLLMAFIYCYSLFLSRLTAFLLHVIVNEWLYSFAAFNLFYIHWSGVLTVDDCCQALHLPQELSIIKFCAVYENLLNEIINQGPQCVDTCEKITYAC